MDMIKFRDQIVIIIIILNFRDKIVTLQNFQGRMDSFTRYKTVSNKVLKVNLQHLEILNLLLWRRKMRRRELQKRVMPQLLNHLSVLDLTIFFLSIFCKKISLLGKLHSLAGNKSTYLILYLTASLSEKYLLHSSHYI